VLIAHWQTPSIVLSALPSQSLSLDDVQSRAFGSTFPVQAPQLPSFWQDCVPGLQMPTAACPQLCESPGRHCPQMPLTQCLPFGQGIPHMLQFLSSLVVLTQSLVAGQ
jgi:hypothetical protein